MIFDKEIEKLNLWDWVYLRGSVDKIRVLSDFCWPRWFLRLRQRSAFLLIRAHFLRYGCTFNDWRLNFLRSWLKFLTLYDSSDQGYSFEVLVIFWRSISRILVITFYSTSRQHFIKDQPTPSHSITNSIT